jgi:hypothetical protein
MDFRMWLENWAAREALDRMPEHGHYLVRHKGRYLAADPEGSRDEAIILAFRLEGGHQPAHKTIRDGLDGPYDDAMWESLKDPGYAVDALGDDIVRDWKMWVSDFKVNRERAQAFYDMAKES